jgi:methyl-accepting chemotaxis protein PixJ
MIARPSFSEDKPFDSSAKKPKIFNPIAGFSNLPISRKTQSITLLIFLSLLGIAIGGAKVLEDSLRSQLQNQTKAALAVTELNYQNGIEKMEVGFASLAENPLLLTASQQVAKGQPLNPQQRASIQQILAKETQILNLEYATLVGKDGRIIINANPSNRVGEKFDPSNLVSQVIAQSRQISSNEIVSWGELQKEKASLPSGLNNQDALIRYTVTPIKSPENGRLIGVLVAGDVVNQDETIVRATVETRDEGYSAVYLYHHKGELALATSLEKTALRQSTAGLPLANNDILTAAVKAKGRPVPNDNSFFTGQIGGRNYTLAARALPNFEGKPVAILVYGDPENTLKRVINTSLITQALLSAIVLCLVPLLAWLIGRGITHPIKRLQRITGEFARGNYQARALIDSTDEVGELARNFNEMADSIENSNRYLIEQSQMLRFLVRLSPSVSPDPDQLNLLFSQAVNQARQILAADRIFIYRHSTDNKSEIISSDTINRTAKLREDSDIVANFLNIYEKKPSPTLEPQQIDGNLGLPIFTQGELFGFLVVQSLSSDRQWQEADATDMPSHGISHAHQETEVNFLKQLAIQLQVILERVSQRQQIELESRLFAHLKDMTLRIAHTLEEMELFDIATKESRQALQTDRVVIYSFDANWIGTFVAESVDRRYPTALGERVGDPCFAERYVEQYRRGRVQATNDISKAGLTACHLQQLEPFGVKANLITPILVAGELYGLLIAHSCGSTHEWQKSEIDFLSQVAIQVGCALERFHLWTGQKESEAEQRCAKERLQQRAIELLMEVDPIRQGDLSICATVSDDEIGTIADAYNATVESLRKIVTRVKSVTQDVTATTEDSTTSIQSLTVRTSQQLEDIQGVMTQIEIMRQAIDQVAVNAATANSSVQSTLESVAQSRDWMTRTVEGMHSVRETVAQTTQKLDNLSESSQKISKVVNLIGRFAAQTHLLALKASIEAARAGEEGRGFAVIADEVRTLASQSAEATAEIESLVATIQNETREVTLSMEAGTEQVSRGSQLLEETRSGLAQITNSSQEIAQLVKAIAESATRQNQTGRSVYDSMVEVATISEQTSQAAIDVAASFDSLLKSSQTLSESVSQFKV